jgi:membrane protein YqaA with SNARE-associated domain
MAKESVGHAARVNTDRHGIDVSLLSLAILVFSGAWKLTAQSTSVVHAVADTATSFWRMHSVTLPLAYAIAIAVVGALCGAIIAYVIGSARNQSLSKELQDAHARLSAVRETTPPVSTRLTGVGVAAVIASITTLLGAIGTFYNHSQSDRIGALEKSVAASRETDSTYHALVTYDPERWSAILHHQDSPTTPPAEGKVPIHLDFAFKKMACDSRGFDLRYADEGPSILVCPAGKVTVSLAGPTRLLFAPAGQQY